MATKNKWTEHVRNYGAYWGLTFGCALSEKNCRASYGKNIEILPPSCVESSQNQLRLEATKLEGEYDLTMNEIGELNEIKRDLQDDVSRLQSVLNFELAPSDNTVEIKALHREVRALQEHSKTIDADRRLIEHDRLENRQHSGLYVKELDELQKEGDENAEKLQYATSRLIKLEGLRRSTAGRSSPKHPSSSPKHPSSSPRHPSSSSPKHPLSPKPPPKPRISAKKSGPINGRVRVNEPIDS